MYDVFCYFDQYPLTAGLGFAKLLSLCYAAFPAGVGEKGETDGLNLGRETDPMAMGFEPPNQWINQ